MGGSTDEGMPGAGPLAGIKVLDFTTTFSGPYCTQQLADLGADVIKVEAPGGDVTRGLGLSIEPGLASVFVATNRNKSSVQLDLRDPDDRALLEPLVREADCLVHNMRLDAAARVGIDADHALELNERLVHCAITGFDSDGPYSGRPAYDDTIQGISGMAWMQGIQGGEPQYVATAVADKVAGLNASQAIIAALFWRASSGKGQSIEVPMFETITSFNLMEQWGGMAFEPPIGPTGYARTRSPHRRPFRTSDGYISVVVYHGGHWQRFLDAIGQGELLQDPRYATPEARNRHISELYGILVDIMPTKTTDEWIEFMSRIDVPAERVVTTDDVFHDPQLNATGFFKVVEEGGRKYRVARHTVKYSHTPAVDPAAAPGPPALDSGRHAVDRWLHHNSDLAAR